MKNKKYNLTKFIKSKNSSPIVERNERKSNSQTPPKNNNLKIYYNKIKEKKLLINLDDTLIHSSNNYIQNPDLTITQQIINENNQKTKKYIYINFHYGTIPFIEEISFYYEIIIFSSLISSIGEIILNIIDPQKRINYKLYCDNCELIQEKKIIKDLNLFGDVKKIVLLDNSSSPIYNEANRIPINNWFDDYKDLELFKLIPILKNLYGFYDVKTEIGKFVQNNTFIWGKAIIWIRDFLLNSTYLNDIDNVLKMEKTNVDILLNSHRNRENNQNKVYNTCNTISNIYDEFNKSIDLNFFDKELNNFNISNENNNKEKKNSISKNRNDFIKITNDYDYNNYKIEKDENDYYLNKIESEENKNYKKDFNKFINHPNKRTIYKNDKKDHFVKINSINKKRFKLCKKPILSSLKGIIMKKIINEKRLNTSHDNVFCQFIKKKSNIKQNIRNTKVHNSQEKVEKKKTYKFISKTNKNNLNYNTLIIKRGNHNPSYSINLSNSINNSNC